MFDKAIAKKTAYFFASHGILSKNVVAHQMLEITLGVYTALYKVSISHFDHE